MSKFNYYKAAFYLCAAVAVTEAIWFWIFVLPRADANRATIPLVATVITVLGLLIKSNLIRYFGGVFMVIWAGAFLWPLISDGTAFLSRPNGVAVFLFYLFFGAISLSTAAILLFSKQFAYEFAKRRDSAPKYIGHLRLLLIVAIVAAAIITTFDDILNLATTP